VQAAYYNLMPPGCFPFSLLFLNCDAREVDVNVHPSKTEVRFRHSSAVHDFVRDTLRQNLMESRPASGIPVPTSPVVVRTSDHDRKQGAGAAADGQRGASLPFSEFSARMGAFITEPEPGEVAAALVVEEAKEAEELPEIRLDIAPGSPEVARGPLIEPERQATSFRAAATRRIPDTHGALDRLPPDWDVVQNLSALPDLRPLGQLHDSFIIATGRDGLWIIDQHVAHERILFEQVLRQRTSGTVEIQRLLMPLVVQLTPSQQFEYTRIADELNAYGFETEPFGQRTVAVKAAPAGVGPADIERIVFEILEISETELRSASLDEVRRDVSATIACRAAIKINTRLETPKIEWLLRNLARCEYPMTCPHGRPIALRYSTRDILKSFHRI
jgi:DNA mismatch repair protein MutL